MGRKISRETRKADRVYKSRSRKRKQIFNPKTAEGYDGGASTSAKKLKNQNEYNVPKTNHVEYRILNFFAVFTAIANLIKCAKCDGNVFFGITSERGLGFTISVVCDNCAPEYIPSCDFIGHSYEINRRFILAMRVLGVGLKGATKFCGLMDLPPFLSKSSYLMILQHISEASKNIAEFFIKKACREEIDLNSKNSEGQDTDLSVSSDGTWHKRGFTSLYGVVSLIGHYTGKVIDVLVKSSYCKACELWKDKTGTAEYKEWRESHEETCSANHTGTAGKMEVDSVIEMFLRSLKNLGVRFLNYIGDGDSKTYSGILKAAPYGKTVVTKKECVGHVQKRIGTYLRGNSNESFNQSVWKFIPKTLPASFTTVSIAANIATCTFNEGSYGLLAVFDAMGIKLGSNAHNFATKEDSVRVKVANRRSAENTREARVVRRRKKIVSTATAKAKEGSLYGAGIDDSI